MTYTHDADIEAMADAIAGVYMDENYSETSNAIIVLQSINAAAAALAASPVHAELATLREKLRVAEDALNKRDHERDALNGLLLSMEQTNDALIKKLRVAEDALSRS